MTTEPAPTPTASRPVSPRQLEWLTAEVPRWREAGLVDDAGAAGILASYHSSRRFDLAALLLTLGAAFVGVGLVWLVASNLDELSPLVRVLVVGAFWLALLVVGEVLAARHERRISPLAGTTRILAAIAFGALLLQAAQSLQVPAYEPSLLAWWGLGALVHGYVVRALGPVVIGVLALGAWVVTQASIAADGALEVLLPCFAAAIVGASVAVLHARSSPSFAPPWRVLGAIYLLGGLFVAALPYATTEDFTWTRFSVLTLSVAGVAAVAALALAPGGLRLEPLLAVAIAGAGVLLVMWNVDFDLDGEGTVGLEGWGRAAVGIGVYVGAAAWIAVLGVLRDSRVLTFVATAALVIFTTFQSFAVFARIIQGAWLFVVLGLIFAATGWLADRGRRQLVRSLGDEPPGSQSPGDQPPGRESSEGGAA